MTTFDLEGHRELITVTASHRSSELLDDVAEIGVLCRGNDEHIDQVCRLPSSSGQLDRVLPQDRSMERWLPSTGLNCGHSD